MPEEAPGSGRLADMAQVDIRVLLARHVPGYEIRSIAQVGSGLDHIVYEVNGELVVRASKDNDADMRADTVRREVDLLALLPRFVTLPVPEPVFADPETGVLAYTKISGRPLLGRHVTSPAAIAARLGEFIGGLHRVEAAEVAQLVPEDTDPPPTWLEDAASAYSSIADHVPPASRYLVEEFLSRTPPVAAERSVFCHNDLGAEHVLVDEVEAVAGVIDWTDAAFADPAHDFARIYRDFGPEAFAMAVSRYGAPWDEVDEERAVFYARCALLEDIAFGVDTGAPLYVDTALAHLERTFG